MSAFDDFNAQSFGDAADIIGTERFTVSGLTGRFCGLLNEFASEKVVDIGGIVGTYTATLVCELEQFDDVTGSIERALDGRIVTIDGRNFKISRCAIDEFSVTLGLTNPAKGK